MGDIDEQRGMIPGGGLGLAPYGVRHSGEGVKGKGYFGLIRRPDGGYSTELSASSDFDGRDVEYPLMVPTLDADELRHLLSGAPPTERIYQKAVEHAAKRLGAGRNPFAEPGELHYPLPQERRGMLPVPPANPLRQHINGMIPPKRDNTRDQPPPMIGVRG